MPFGKYWRNNPFVFSSVTYSEILRIVAAYEARVRWHGADSSMILAPLSERGCRG